MTGKHRGGRSWRRRLVVAVLASVGRSYLGRHRLAAAALGAPVPFAAEVAVSPPERVGPPERVSPPERVGPPAPSSQNVRTETFSRASVAPRLRIVTVATSPDPLVDTMPHPVVSLFPVSSPHTGPLAAACAEDAVFDEIDGQRDLEATAALAAADFQAAEDAKYRTRHTA